MARLLTAGAETADATTEGVSSNTGFTLATNVVRTGSRSFETSNGSGLLRFNFTGATGTTYYGRAYCRLTALPSSGAKSFLMFRTAAAGALVAAYVTSTGAIRLMNEAGATQIGSDSVETVAINTWFRVELSVNIGAGAVDTAALRLNGVDVASGSSLTISDTAPGLFGPDFATYGVAFTGYFDDIAVNNNSGSDQASWPGEAKVVLLVPTADSAVGTGWTLGTGTAVSSNAFDAVNNTPPTGVADLTAGSDPKQIRNASSNANTNYDATMTTYTAAGMGPQDNVRVIDPIVATAAPVSTSAKQGTVGVSSNPAITNVALGAGGTSGAFWSGVAGGTYPTGWKISHGTVTYNPTVTLGTAPVMRITQVTSSTRIAVVCFMGMYVEYEPWLMPALVMARQGPT